MILKWLTQHLLLYFFFPFQDEMKFQGFMIIELSLSNLVLFKDKDFTSGKTLSCSHLTRGHLDASLGHGEIPLVEGDLDGTFAACFFNFLNFF